MTRAGNPIPSRPARIVVVTGAGSGIGAATALRLADDGASVWLLDIDAESVDRVAASITGANARAVDIGDPVAVERVFDSILDAEGRIDGLAHVAGLDGKPKLRQYVADVIARAEGEPEFDILSQISDDDWRDIMRVNLDGTFYCVRSALKAMIPHRAGSIVTTSSLAAINPSPFNPHYAAAKAGVRAFTMAMAKSVATFGIRMNCVAPGATDTPMLSRMPESVRRHTRAPIGRPAQPEEVASVIAFLLGDDASYIIGETVNVNGGIFTS